MVESAAKYVARCMMINEDASRRNLVAVIQMTAEQKFQLRLLKENEESIYERIFDKMPACWYLAKEEFAYMEELSSNKITVVRLNRGEVRKRPGTEEDFVQELRLPADIVIKNPVQNEGLDALIEAHSCTDKQALKDLIKSEQNPIEPPSQTIISCLKNQMFFIAESGVFWFPIDRKKGQTEDVQMSELKEVTGWNDDHRAIGLFCSEQSRSRQEFWVVTENLKSKKLGMQLFWDEDNGEMEI